MKITKQGLSLVIVITLCFSLSNEVVNGTNDVQQDANSLVTEEQQIKQFPGGILIDFDDKSDFDSIDTSYAGLEFSSGYYVWNSSDSIYYPPESGEFVAVSNEINNWFVFEMPIQKVGMFVSTAIDEYNLVFTAYTNNNAAIEEISIIANTPNQYIEFDSPLGRINNISVSGTGVWYTHWTIDSLSYLELISPTPNLIDFEDLASGSYIGGAYSGITFSPDFVTWNSFSSNYIPRSGNNVIYSNELTANITFSFPVDFVSFYVNVAINYDVQVLAYSESGILLGKDYVYGRAINQYVAFKSLQGMIHRITFTGSPGFNSYWTLDDLCYAEHTPGENQLLTFDELDSMDGINTTYANVEFSTGYAAWYSSGSSIYPPHTGDNVLFSHELVSNITFDNPIAYVSFYISTYSDYNWKVEVYNEDDILIQIFDVNPDAKNQLVELYSDGGFIHRISILGDTGFEIYWTIDTLYFEEYKETFEFLLAFEDYRDDYLSLYPHVTFSEGFTYWNSYGNIYYPPNSGKNVALSHELSPNITFTIPIMYASFYICSPLDYSLDVLAYTSSDQLIFKTSVEPDSIDKFVEIYSENSEISRITINGTAGYNTHWTIDNLYYVANPDTYDLDGDGLSYNEELIYNTDPLDSDSDDDGYPDGEEVVYGSDPTDPLDFPIYASEFGYMSLILFVPLIAVLGLLFRKRK